MSGTGSFHFFGVRSFPFPTVLRTADVAGVGTVPAGALILGDDGFLGTQLCTGSDDGANLLANQILGFPSISLVGVVLGVGSLSGKGPRCAANRSYGSALVGLTRGVFAAEAVPSSFESALRLPYG
ncbi:hypothetical protein Tco_0666820 [Tanacetum coccineum]